MRVCHPGELEKHALITGFHGTAGPLPLNITRQIWPLECRGRSWASEYHKANLAAGVSWAQLGL